MAIHENLSTLENANSLISVKLHQNHLKKDGTYYVRVDRHNVKFNNIISELAEENKAIDPHLLQYAAILIQKKILKLIQQGKAVNLLDIGTIYIGMKCSAKAKKDVQEKGDFLIKFSPTQFTLDAISSLDVGNVIFADPNFTITDIVDLYTKEENQTLTMGKPAKITGTKLKLGDENSGIFFAPLTSDSEINSDESTWIKVPQESIFRNKPTELNFFVPETLESGKSYCIVLKTNYISNSQTRKEILETESAPIKIV